MTIKSIATTNIYNTIAESVYDELLTNSSIFYTYIGKIMDFVGDENIALDNKNYEIKVRNNIVYLKRVNPNDIAHVVKRIDWVTGTVYDMYDDNYHGASIANILINSGGTGYDANTTAYVVGGKGRNTDLSVSVETTTGSITGIIVNDAGIEFTSIPQIVIVGTGTGASAVPVLSSSYVTHSGYPSLRKSNFYVLTTDYNVYKCIDNNNINKSVNMPSKTIIDPFNTADGYMWKFMYHIPMSLRKKFLTIQYMPVYNVLTSSFYSNGGLDYVTVTDGGSGYATSGSDEITVVGDGTGAVLQAQISSLSHEIFGATILGNGNRYYPTTTKYISSITKTTVSGVCTVTVTTGTAHRLVAGTTITIQNAGSTYNGTYVVNSPIVNNNTFTMTLVGGTGTESLFYGNITRTVASFSIASITSMDNVATITTTTAHGLNDGGVVTVANVVANTLFNTNHTIEKIISPTAFTVSFVGSVTSGAVGTVVPAPLVIYTIARSSNVVTVVTRHPHNFFAPISISLISATSGVITVTATGHGLRNGDVVNISGTTAFNVTGVTIANVTLNTFTFTSAIANTSETAGYINCAANVANIIGYTGSNYSVSAVIDSRTITFAQTGTNDSTYVAPYITYNTGLNLTSTGIGKYTGNSSAVLQPNILLKNGFDYSSVPNILIPDAAGTYAKFTGSCEDTSTFSGSTTYVTQFTGSISTTQLSVSSISSNRIVIGQTVVGIGIAPNTIITAFVSGTNGGAGVYTVSISQTVASGTGMVAYIGTAANFTAAIATNGQMTVATPSSGALIVGQTISGAGISIGTTITAFVSGINGGAGVYTLSWSPSVAIAAGTAVTATMSTNNIYVSSVSSGSITINQVLSGTGVNTNTTISAIIYANSGGIYTISSIQNIASTVFTGIKNSSIMNVTAVSAGTIVIGQTIAGSNIISGTTITGFVSGTAGGIGYYNISIPQYFTSTAITVSATATATVTGTAVSGITLNTKGSGYSIAPVVYFMGGSTNMVTATATVANGSVSGITINTYGVGYSTAPLVYLAGGGGTGATATAVVSKGTITQILITNAGTGYISAPLVYFSGTSGMCCSATTRIYNGTVDRIEIDSTIDTIKIVDPGKGYSPAAAATITVNGDGTGASLTPYIKNGSIRNIAVDSKGEGYTFADITINGTSTTSAKAYANFSTTSVNGQLDTNQYNVEILAAMGAIHVIKVENGGIGYRSTDTVTISGDGGYAAASIVVDGNGTITKVIVSNYGYNYNIATATVSTYTGSGAVLRPIISPTGGHGKNAIAELYADNMMFFTKMSATDTYSTYPISNKFYQYGLFRSPKIYNDNKDFSDQLGSTCFDVMGTFNGTDFTQGGTVKIMWNGIANYFYVVELKLNGMLLQQNSGNSYIPMISDIVVNDSTNISFTITQINYPTVNKSSGDIIDINNVTGFNKTDNQIISLRTIINI